MKIFVLLLLNVISKRVKETDQHQEPKNPAKTLVPKVDVTILLTLIQEKYAFERWKYETTRFERRFEISGARYSKADS